MLSIYVWLLLCFLFSFCSGFEFIGKGSATFVSMEKEIKKYFLNPRHPIPQRVFVFLGSNDLDAISSTAEVIQVTQNAKLWEEH